MLKRIARLFMKEGSDLSDDRSPLPSDTAPTIRSTSENAAPKKTGKSGRALTGACLCGTIRYRCRAEPAAFINCHCKDCQRCTGSTHAPVLMVPSGSVEIEQGETHYFENYGTDGTFVRRHFCPGCGSQMFTELPDQDEWMFIKVGSIDDVSSLSPTMTAWTDSAPHFSHIPDHIPAFPKNPPA